MKIIKSFQDPLSRKLAEAVRIDFRGENILNSKAEYSRCRVPRLRVDMEGWKEKVKEEAILDVRASTSASLDTTTMTSSLQEDQQIKYLTQDAEDSLEELELKRKLDDQVGHAGRIPKRLRLERLEGWGMSPARRKD